MTCYLRKRHDEIVRAIETPQRSDFHGMWYVAGHRWIKSRQKWSGNALIFLLGDSLREVPCPDGLQVCSFCRNAAAAKNINLDSLQRHFDECPNNLELANG